MEKEKEASFAREKEKREAQEKQLAQDAAATMITLPTQGQLVVTIVKNQKNIVEIMTLYEKNHGDVRNLLRRFAKEKNPCLEDVNEFVRKNMAANGLAFTLFPKSSTKRTKSFHLNRYSLAIWCLRFLISSFTYQ